MTKEEQIDWLCRLRADINNGVIFTPWNKEFTEALTEVLEQQSSEDTISREDAINAAIDAVDDCNISRATMIRNAIKKLPSVTPKQSFINKPCISEGICHEDKVNVLEKIRAEIENHCGLAKEDHCRYCSYCNSLMGVRELLETIDKYKAESEGRDEG